MMFLKRLEKEIRSLKEKDLYRNRTLLPKGVVDFSSNDYLGLKDCSYTKKELLEQIKNLSLGSGASALVSGYTYIQKQLEEKIADLKESENCVVIGSGYMANIGLIQAIVKEEDTILSDQYNHASIIDGIRLTKAEKLIYKHMDLEDLEKKIKKRKNKGQIFIVTDGVFSMEGSIAPLDKIIKIRDRYQAVLIIDDAHSTGILGNGKGTLFHFNLKPDENIIQMGTLSKAIGSYGAFICGSKTLIEYLINKMRPAIFSTALSPVQNFISLINIKIMEREKHRRDYVLQNAEMLFNELKQYGINIKFYGTPILPLIVGKEEIALKLRDYLLQHGYFVQAIRPPTVPAGTSRLRITLSYNHSKKDIKNLAELLKKFFSS